MDGFYYAMTSYYVQVEQVLVADHQDRQRESWR
jgi:hypothetical protein